MNISTMSEYDVRELCETVKAFGRTWGAGFVARLVTQGQISQADADRVLSRVRYAPPFPTEWLVK